MVNCIKSRLDIAFRYHCLQYYVSVAYLNILITICSCEKKNISGFLSYVWLGTKCESYLFWQFYYLWAEKLITSCIYLQHIIYIFFKKRLQLVSLLTNSRSTQLFQEPLNKFSLILPHFSFRTNYTCKNKCIKLINRVNRTLCYLNTKRLLSMGKPLLRSTIIS